MENPSLLVASLAAGKPLPDTKPGQWNNDSLSGVYHSEHASSYWSNGQFPSGFSLTLNMKFAPNALSYKGVNDTNPDKLYINAFEATLDDKPAPIAGNKRYNEVRIRQLGPREFQVLEQLDGDVIVGQYWVFSDDTKVLMRWGVGKSPENASKAFFETFIRKD
ncbi:hypothetical protein FJU08_21550 [Martelella alba]|uniref:Uncharacterized protein n=1 Tax=Martelella alba TaxID=2590451 RepID=A0A506U4F2_9HYPH|nr:hypothetical protein [Martelella alba]TPW26757.1 hypothetical protein FJU08_21550 [Martelella alba]